jgi:SPP1 gp7 family putative phage head morphogenesis protein
VPIGERATVLAQIRARKALGLGRSRKRLPRQLAPMLIALEYSKVIEGVVAEAWKLLEAEAFREVREVLAEAAPRRRTDSKPTDVNALFDRVSDLFFGRLNVRALESAVDLFGRRTSEFQHAQLKKQIVAFVGVDIFVAEPNLTGALAAFTAESVALIKSIPNRLFDDVEKHVAGAVRAGVRWEELAEELRTRRGVAESDARRVARDQVGKLYSRLNETRQQEIGVDAYIWRTSNDARVRDSHEKREGKRFLWSDPPALGHPGTEVLCRCYAEPDLDDLINGTPQEQLEDDEIEAQAIAEEAARERERQRLAQEELDRRAFEEHERRLAAEEAARLEQDRLAREERDRQWREALERAERLEREAERLKQERLEQERIKREAFEQFERERLERQRLELEREAQRERDRAAQREAERLENERLNEEAGRLREQFIKEREAREAAEKLAAEKREKNNAAARARRAAKKIETERLAREAAVNTRDKLTIASPVSYLKPEYKNPVGKPIPVDKLVEPPKEIKTKKAFEEWASKNWPNVDFDMEGVDVALLPELATEVHDRGKEFPEVMARLRYFGTYKTRNPWGAGSEKNANWNNNTYAHASMTTGEVLALNPAKFGDGMALYRSLLSDESTGFHPKGALAVSSIVAHEFGHLVDGWQQAVLTKYNISPYVVGAVGEGAWLARDWRREKKATAELSRYAMKDNEEGFAEAFSSLYYSPPGNGGEHPKSVRKMLDWLVKNSAKLIPKNESKNIRDLPFEDQQAAYEEAVKTVNAIYAELGLKKAL